MMSFEQLIDEMTSSRPYGDAALAVMKRYTAERAHLPKPRREMPPYNYGPRKELTELTPKHLDWIEELVDRPSCSNNPGRPSYDPALDRQFMEQHMLAHYGLLFGRFRKTKAHEVPSDTFRKQWMIGNLLDIVDQRRERRANLQPTFNDDGVTAYHPSKATRRAAYTKRANERAMELGFTSANYIERIDHGNRHQP